MRRRALLLAVGCTAIAGCQSVLPDTDETVRLGVLQVVTHVEREQEVDVEILADAETVHETTVTLGAADVNQPTWEILEKDWPDEAHSYLVRVRSEIEDDPVELRLEDPLAESCETLQIQLRDERVRLFRGTAGQCYEGYEYRPD